MFTFAVSGTGSSQISPHKTIDKWNLKKKTPHKLIARETILHKLVQIVSQWQQQL